MSTQTPNLRQTLNFLNELSRNNNKVWFDENRAAYEQARASFEDLVNDIIDARRTADDLKGLMAKDCVMRINRDIRFSKDKSPYKTNLGANIAPGGRHAEKHGYHISIGPNGNSIVAGGLYMPEPAQLAAFRRAIDEDAGPFKKLTSAKAFVKYFGKIEGDTVATAPQGYSRTHPEIALLKLKQVVVVHHYSDKEVAAPGFTAEVLAACQAMRPLLNYLDQLE